ncbi:MAG TPA: inorganic phosphate transporter [Candidatus Krumholzibacteria bacterium]|nr:inorganic phosphate transporter [Candidatus Krumholzibacteria bacterium]
MGVFLFLSSGLFLGWSLGANDAANVFGTAVGTRMVRFRTAAVVCSVFIVLGAVISGAGAAHTLGRLGAVNALAGSFTVALSAALTTYWMTRLKLPVSTSQAIVGAIIGWNFYTSAVTDASSLTKIVTTWIACPLLSAAVAVVMMVALRFAVGRLRPHLLVLDAWTRLGLLAVGAFGSYSLGANNIANVMGVFVPDNPFRDVEFGGFTLSGGQLLFALGGIAIGVGVFTYSERVMRTVGGGLLRLSPLAALVVVLAQSVTLFLFASEGLQHALASRGLPTFPLVPVSSSQAVIGAIIGIGVLRGGRGIRYGVLGEISLGWAATPVLAGALAFVLLFVVDNVFDQQVSRPVAYRIDQAVIAELEARGIRDQGLAGLEGRLRTNSVRLKHDLRESTKLKPDQILTVIEVARLGAWRVDAAVIATELDREWLTSEQLHAVRSLVGRDYRRSWELRRDLAAASAEWRPRPASTVNRVHNKELEKKLEYLETLFQVAETRESPDGASGEPADAGAGFVPR